MWSPGNANKKILVVILVFFKMDTAILLVFALALAAAAVMVAVAAH